VVTSSAPTEFVIDNDGCKSQPLIAGNSCIVKMHFQPAAVGNRQATLTANAGDHNGGAATVTLSGTGLTPANFKMAPSAKEFDPQDLNTGSSAVTFTVSNPGASDTGAITTKVTGNTADFTVTDNCNGKALTANTGTCSYVVSFAPKTYGSKNLSIVASSTPGGMVTASLTGLGRDKVTLNIGLLGGPGSVSVAPAGLSCSTANCAFQVYRNTQVTLTESTSAGDFFSAWSGDCTAASSNATCTITLDTNKNVNAGFYWD
jgi:hypothetical protein